MLQLDNGILLKIRRVVLFVTISWILCSADKIAEKCKVECEGMKSGFKENNYSERYDCNVTCKMEQCFRGCSLWNKLANSSCIDSCGISPVGGPVDICVQSCSKAVKMYINETAKEFRRLGSPAMQSTTNVSVTLCWSVNSLPPLEPGFTLSYHLQKLIVGLSDDWQFHNSTEWLSDQQVKVSELKPFVNYKFRVVLVIGGDVTEPLPESYPIVTNASGTPLEAPEVVSLTTTSTSLHLKAKPPFFMNGDLVGFRLMVSRSKRDGYPRIKDIVTKGNLSEVITMLQPDTEYEVKLAAINRVGVGPELSKTVRTRSQNPTSGASAYLLFSVDNKLSKQDLSDLFRQPQDLFEDPDKTVLLTEVAIHYAYKFVFVATNNDHVYRINISNGKRLTYNATASIRGLTIDWLHDYLYVAVGNQILECDLNMTLCRVAVDLKDAAVNDLHVDPCNGYLYWTQKVGMNGLFKLDLDDLKAVGSVPSPVVLGSINGFVIDYLNYRIFYPNETNHVMISINLDGSEPFDIHTNTQLPNFSSVTGLTYNKMNGSFFWTTGRKLMMEEFDVENNKYHHTEMIIHSKHFGDVDIWSSGSQPIPVPIVPPKNLQVLASSTSSVIVSWQPPEPDQGKGAWQQWSYVVETTDAEQSANQTLTKTVSTELKIENLEPGHLYHFRVQGTSEDGSGPWSENFTTQTLSAGDPTVVLMYADDTGVIKSTVDGVNKTPVVNSTVFKGTITDLIASSGTIYAVSGAGLVHCKAQNQLAFTISGISDAGILAFDWLTHRLYWTHTRLNQIKRVSVQENATTRDWNSVEETLIYASSRVLDLVLDVLEARMYWTTSSTVETSYLDGQGHRIVQKHDSFSGQHVLGLAVDPNGHELFWMVRDVSKLVIYKSKLINLMDVSDSGPKRVLEFSGKVMNPSLAFHSNKLFWMGQKNTVNVLDVRGQSVAQIQLAAADDSEITTFTIASSKDSRNASIALNNSEAFGIPGSVDVKSLIITKQGNDFNVSWDPIPVGRGKVYYRMWLQVDGFHRQERVSFSAHVLLPGLKFYSEIDAIVVACSYWGCGDQVQNTFHSVMAEKSVQSQLTFALSTSLGVILALTMLAFCVLILTCLGHKDKKTLLSAFVRSSSIQSNDHELATLRHLPNVALETANVLYVSSFLPGTEEIASLPHFPHSCLRLTKFLGSGAFGKVFEGVALNILHENSGDTKVAVKTLHKSASDNEKEEFLKEALLMNNFKHDHILRLLGVCLDHDPQFLILELMDGGDLLTFLRASRPSFVSDTKLTLSDMVGICKDVGKGCKYMEDMHFVHRDLAARNCLVSFTGSSIVVKIGDFGLARDIYRNDYYKKEGEGLLPVRWMSPESLIDGIFTTQSDVWAYGVLVWEVLTLGQQPYPAQTNLEVLHFVRSGGRLDCPENCPSDLYQLMLKCWLYLPLKRPSFHDIVKQLNVFSHQMMTAVSESSIDANCPPGGFGRPLKIQLSLRTDQLKPRYSSDSNDIGNTSRVSAREAEFMILDPLSLTVPRGKRRQNGSMRAALGCQGNCRQVGGCRGIGCGYLQPNSQPRDQHPKYLELIDVTLPSLEDSLSSDG